MFRNADIRAKRVVVWCHRWTALTVGLLLVVVSTSGALVVYAPELLRAGNAELFRSTPSERPIDFTAAIDAVTAQDQEFDPAEIALKDGVFMLTGSESELTYFVDAGTGAVNGQRNLYGGAVGFLENLHDCALTCEGHAGYTPWLSSPAPLAGLAPFEEMTWGAVLLAVAGAALVFLAVTAPFIWWPGLRRWRNAFRLRWRRGRFARDFDLRNVIGIVVLIPLLIWGLTGLNFEVPGFRDVWDAATGGQSPPEDNYSMEPSENPGPSITLDQAMTSATKHFPGAQVTWVGMPTEDAEFYSIDLLDGGPNLWAHNAVYEGNPRWAWTPTTPSMSAFFSVRHRQCPTRSPTNGHSLHCITAPQSTGIGGLCGSHWGWRRFCCSSPASAPGSTDGV